MGEVTPSALIRRARRSVWPAVSVEEALGTVLREVAVTRGTRTVPVANVRTGDVLAENIVATRALPEVRTSVKDGYAVIGRNSATIIASDGKGLREVVSGTTAGVLASIVLQPGTICRVNTGSMIPYGADAVVQVEDTRLVEHNNTEEVLVEILTEPAVGQDIREIGCDVKLGEILLFKGCVLGAPEIGILTLSERRYVEIFRKPKVAIMSTGDEVVDSGSNDCPLGHVRDTNRPQLMALLKEHNFKPIDIGILPDKEEKIQEGLEVALTMCDVAVCSGGVSMGEKDYLKEVLQRRFNFIIKFGRVMMKPGLPTTFACGKWNNVKKFVFALPGNPVSTYVTAQLFVLPALKKMAGWENYHHTVISVKVSDSLQLDNRPEYRRARLQSDANIPRAVCLEEEQMSSRLLSVRRANLLLKLDARTDAKSAVQKDEIVDALVIGRL